LPQIKVKPNKVKASGVPSRLPLAAFRREASELDQPGHLGMQYQRKLP